MAGKHGGKRTGAGRKSSFSAGKLTRKNSTVVRVSLPDKDRLKSGQYERLLELLYQWRLETLKASETSLRWQKLKALFSQIDKILGKDFDSWLD